MKLSRVELSVLRLGKARDSRIFVDRRRSIGRRTTVDVELFRSWRNARAKKPVTVAFRGEYHPRLCFADGRIGFDGNLSNYVDPVNSEFS